MGYAHGNLGKTGGTVKRSSNNKTLRNIKKLPTWKGDPNNKVAIDEWKRSYEPGYTPQIISPRNSKGKYTSDPKETVNYIAMDQVTHAKEVAIALQSEPKIPMSIADSLKKTLKNVTEKIKGNPPTATTTTKIQPSNARHLTDFTHHKLTVVTVGVFIIIFASLHILKRK